MSQNIQVQSNTIKHNTRLHTLTLKLERELLQIGDKQN